MASRRIVIVGGGFAGAFTARHLRSRLGDGLSVELISDRNYFVFQPLLPEVAAGTVSVLDAVTPLRLMLPGIGVRVARVASFNLAAKTVKVIQGALDEVVEVPYDELVLAFGQVVDLSRYPGLPEHGLTMKDASDAYQLRNHVIACLEDAAIATDPGLRRRLLTFAVIGGGLSGVETIGEIEELVHRTLRFYPNIRRSDIRFILIEYQKRLLPELDDDLAAYATRKLAERGVEIRLGVGIRSAAASAVEIVSGESGAAEVIETMTVVATIGNGPSPLLKTLGVPTERGKILTDRTLRVRGHEHVWAAGDCARIPLAGGDDPPLAPPTAQAAVREAKLLARNLAAAARGGPLETFNYHSRGTLASLGGRKGVANVMGYHISGFPAWVLWRFAYLAMLPNMTTRIRVFVDRLLDFILPRNTVQTEMAAPQSVRFVRHRAGDVVVRPGQWGGGFFVVVSGSYERQCPTGPEVYRPGHHFGEEAVLEHRPETSVVRAREDSAALNIRREDFERMAEAFDIAPPPEVQGPVAERRG